MCVVRNFNCVQLFATIWTVTHQAPLSMGFSRQEYCRGLPCPPLGNLPHPGIELAPFTSPALAGRFFTTSTTWEAHIKVYMYSAKLVLLKFKNVDDSQMCV